MKKKKYIPLLIFTLLCLILTACEGPVTEDKDHKDISVKSEDRNIDSKDSLAYLADLTPYRDITSKHYACPESGHWELKDVKAFGPSAAAFENDAGIKDAQIKETADGNEFMVEVESEGISKRIIASYSGLEEIYQSGQVCYMSVYFREKEETASEDGKLFGSLYFADVEDSEYDPSKQKIQIRDFFQKNGGVGSKPEKMRHFTKDSDMVSKTETDAGGMEHTGFEAKGCFPKMVEKEGDTVCLVLDISASDGGKAIFRNVWEYSWAADEYEEGKEETEELTSDELEERENDPDWMKWEYSGQWDIKEIYHIGPVNPVSDKDSVEVTAARYGVDGEKMVYTYKDEAGGREVTYELSESFYPSMYAGNLFTQPVTVCTDSEDDDPIGDVICAYGFCDVEFDAGKFGIRVTPKEYFTRHWPEKIIETFSVFKEDGDMEWNENTNSATISLDTRFPDGESEDDKKYIVYGVMDDLTGEVRMYDVYEYGWTEGPIVIWDYNPPMPD